MATRKMSNCLTNRKSLGRKLRLMHGKFLCVVTGAGNGLGRAIANLVFQESGIHPLALGGSRLILIDKDMDSLRETSGKKMKQFLKHRKIEVELVCADLSDLNKINEVVKDMVNNYDQDFEEVILINNITTLGNITKTLCENTDFSELQNYFDLNITSKLFLTTMFCNGFAPSKKTIVNTMNFDANRPTKYLGLPNIASSAIESFSEVFAMENPKIKVLIFKPNRVDSNSTNEILENCLDKELTMEIEEQRKKNKLKQPLETAKKLTKLLEEHKFEQGKAFIWTDDEVA